VVEGRSAPKELAALGKVKGTLKGKERVSQ